MVTSDNGLPFPRAKGHIYDEGYRLPLAIRWPGVVKPNRKVDDFMRFDDLAHLPRGGRYQTASGDDRKEHYEHSAQSRVGMGGQPPRQRDRR